MKIEENVSLREMTTMKVGGKARYFCRVKNQEELKEALAFVRSEQIPFEIFGGGSNVLVKDEGFAGMVIKNEMKGISFVDMSDGTIEAKVGAGEEWDAFVKLAVEKGLYGLENLSGIPGTVGAAPVQNIGAYGVEVKDVIVGVEVFDTKHDETDFIANEDCHFGYRESIFKTPEGKQYFIERVVFKLRKNGKLRTDYKDIQKYLEKSGKSEFTLQALRAAVLEIRSGKFPDLSKVGTAGSFFKNPIISRDKFQNLLQKFPNLPSFDMGEAGIKIPLAWILDNVCDMKGRTKGDVGLHDAQPIVLVNHGKATAEEIHAFASHVAHVVKEKTDIDIEWEVQKI
jgi:UDP-N-acetylmuramate dehydrogenase